MFPWMLKSPRIISPASTDSDSLTALLVSSPWWIGPICAALVFIFFRLIIPTILGGVGKPDDAMAKTFGAVLVPISTRIAPLAASAVIFLWLLAELKKLMDRKRLDSQTGLDSIGDLSWQEFEELVAEAFRREGYEAEVRGDVAGDGGVDVVLRRKAEKTLVQCKHWKSWTVGVTIVRELRGVMAGEKADYGIVVSYGTFTPEAEAFARDNRITLIGGKDLDKMVKAVQRIPRVPTSKPAEPLVAAASASPQRMATISPPEIPSCPLCGSSMVRRTARKGANAGTQFWGCPKYPTCKGIQDLESAR